MEKIRLGISRCLLGYNVRYDGGHRLDHYLTDTIGKYVDWIDICPEVDCGLPVPREAMRLVGDPKSPRLVTIKTNIDYTEKMLNWSKKILPKLSEQSLSGFIFKSGSPSSGLQNVRIYNKKGIPTRNGVGIFAREFVKYFPLLPVEDDGRLHNLQIRENFFEHIFVYNRWQEFLQNDKSIDGLVKFHTAHKLLIMSHSQKHLSLLGKLVANAKSYDKRYVFNEYIKILTEGIKKISTQKNHINIFLHIIGYFKKQLSSEEKKEFLEIVEQYRKNYVPILVPITILRHYINKYDNKYLKQQYYLNPHPAELMLRNHV